MRSKEKLYSAQEHEINLDDYSLSETCRGEQGSGVWFQPAWMKEAAAKPVQGSVPLACSATRKRLKCKVKSPEEKRHGLDSPKVQTAVWNN